MLLLPWGKVGKGVNKEYKMLNVNIIDYLLIKKLKIFQYLFGLYYKLVYICNIFITIYTLLIKLIIIMENEEKMMTGEESLRIITEMINKTKVNISQGSFHLLFWGWL